MNQKELIDLTHTLIELKKKEKLPNNLEKIVDNLHEVIKFHEWRYSVKNDPIISDFEYDQLFDFLKRIEKKQPKLQSNHSPTQRVSNDLTSDFKSVEHLTPMLSLDNSYNLEDLEAFDKRVKKLTGLAEEIEIEYCVEPKFDGGSVAVIYENGNMVRAATRGNGSFGEEITNNIKTLRSIPLSVPMEKMGYKKMELRGEVLIRKDIFNKINDQRVASGKSLFANPRNAATGGLRMKDPKEAAKRGMDAFLYQVGYLINMEDENILDSFSSHSESIERLAELGFKVPEKEMKVCKNIQEVEKFCREWSDKREDYAYEIDGMVIKVNLLELQKKCGYTSHHPRWAIAYKFKAKQATTILENVEFQVGKIGSITPVAKLKPVQLAGVTVSSVSLHNEEFINSRDLYLGDQILVERAGDVIPYIVKSFPEMRDGSETKVVFPTHCPSCSSILEKDENVAAWRCVNTNCEAQLMQKIIFFVSKNGMDMDGFGKSFVERFMKEGWLTNFADVFKLDYEKIGTLEGFGKKSAANLKKSIESQKHLPIYKVLASLSIQNFGKKASKLVAEHIEHILDLEKWTLEEFVAIKGIGPIVAQNVIDFFQNEENIEILKEMETLGVNFTQLDADKPAKLVENAIFSGKSMLFTGKLLRLTRKEAQNSAKENGAKIASGVSSKLDILVVGEKAGSKLKKAKALGTVEIMTEDEFIDKLEKL